MDFRVRFGRARRALLAEARDADAALLVVGAESRAVHTSAARAANQPT